VQRRFIYDELSVLWVIALLLLPAIFQTTSLYSQCSFSQGPPGEICTSAHYICGSDLNGYTGRLPEVKSVQQMWIGCNGNGQPDNIIWYSFTPTSNTVTLRITPSNCTVVVTGGNSYSGIQAGIYSECRQSAALDCTDRLGDYNGKTEPFILTSDQFVPCQPAFLFLDGYAFSVCDFTIEVLEGIDVTPMPPPNLSTLAPGFITGPDTLECNQRNTPVRYSLTAPECLFRANPNCNGPVELPNDSVCFEWKVAPAQHARFVGGKRTGSFADIIFTRPGSYTVSAESFIHPFYGGSCGTGGCAEILSWQVFVKGPDTIRLDDIFVCPGQGATVCGTFITTDTTISCYSGLDSCRLLVQKVIAGTNKLNDIGTQYICEGGEFRFQNVSYNNEGSFEVVDENDCTLLHRFSVRTVRLSTTITAPVTTLDCNNTLLSLRATTNTNFPDSLIYNWASPSGISIGSGDQVSVDIPGLYRLNITAKVGSAVCTVQSTVQIGRDVEVPTIQLNIPTFNCQRPTGIITVTPSRTLAQAQWRLPVGGQIIQSQNLMVDSVNVRSGGQFQFSAKADNGCTVDTVITLLTDFQRPTLELRGEDLTCRKPVTTLNFSSDMAFDSVRWIYNGFFQQTTLGNTYNANQPGNYTVEVRANRNKCWNDDTKLINEDKIKPLVEAGPDLVWHCNTTELNVTPTISNGTDFEYTWQSNNGRILTPVNRADITVGSTGTYVIEVLNTRNGCTSNDVFSVNKETNVPVDILTKISDPLCNGQNNAEIEIQSIVGGFEPYTIIAAGSPVINNRIRSLRAGRYFLELRDRYDCKLEKEIVIQDPPVLTVDLPLEIELAFKENTTLSFVTNYPVSQIASISWRNQQGVIISNTEILDYEGYKDDEITVEIETINGCRAESRIKVNVDTNLKLWIPNIFSPNGDGTNDVFFIGKNKIPADIDQIAIYDRYGNKVYQSSSLRFNEAETGWDGTFNGRPVESGVYVMILQITDFLGNKQVIKQNLQIVH
jgi:gliding motility-associated-like protein